MHKLEFILAHGDEPILSAYCESPTGLQHYCRKFMSGVTMKFPHCVVFPGTVVHGCVLICHRAQLDKEFVQRCVSGDGAVGFEGWTIVY